MSCHSSIVLALLALLSDHGFGRAQRTITFDPDKTIASQLLPTDSEVTVVKLGPPPGGRTSSPTLEERVVSLRQSPAALLISGAAAEGIVTADGTWVRSRIVANIEHVARVADHVRLNTGEPIEFSHRDGAAVVDGVNVRAGEWPVFATDQRYIVSLEYGVKSKEFTVVSAYAVDHNDEVSPVFLSDGAWFSDVTPLRGLKAQELLRRIAEKR
jgi:hypothetical protein